MDHEANVATWAALERDGAKLVWWRMRENGNLCVEDLKPLLSSKTRLVACTVTSNALGIDCGRGRGRETRARVRARNCFWIACITDRTESSMCRLLAAIIWCAADTKFSRRTWDFCGAIANLLDRLPTFREDFVPDTAPTKFEVGTYVYENVAGMDAAVVYLESLGKRLAGNGAGKSRARKYRSCAGSDSRIRKIAIA